MRSYLRAANAAIAALVCLEVLWEAWLAPLRPGGSWLIAKALPLALMLPALWRGRSRARQVAALVLLPYMTEGIVRAFSEHGRTAVLAGAAAALAIAAFAALFLADRAERRQTAPTRGA